MTSRIQFTVLIVTASLLTASPVMAGKMYQCRSADGGVEFSNIACSDNNADRSTVMRLQDRQPWEISNRNEMEERANRFSAQREAWAAQERARRASGNPSTQSGRLTYSQQQALRNSQVGRPRYDDRLTPAQNAAALNAHNAKARQILGAAGLNPGDYIQDAPVTVRSPPSYASEPSQVIDPYSGTVMPRTGSGYIDPRDGTYYEGVGGGIVNTRTGEFVPTN